jgi:hypothetical protein
VPITFIEEDFRLKSTNHNDAMVIEENIAGWVIRKIVVDSGSSADIIFLKTFENMNLTQHMLHPPEYPLQGLEENQSRQLEKCLFQYLSEILTMPEHKLSLSMWLIYIIHIS